MIKITSGGAIGAAASQLTYNIVEKLCKSYCTNSNFQPIVTKTWTLANTEVVNNLSYFTIQCVVNVTYQPRGACSVCGQKTNTFIENFVVSFPDTGTITFADNNAFTEPAYTNTCGSIAHGISNVGNISITFTAS